MKWGFLRGLILLSLFIVFDVFAMERIASFVRQGA